MGIGAAQVFGPVVTQRRVRIGLINDDPFDVAGKGGQSAHMAHFTFAVYMLVPCFLIWTTICRSEGFHTFPLSSLADSLPVTR